MKTFVINICLIPEKKVYELSEKLNKLDSWNYNKNTEKYIPHATLVQKTVDEKDLEFLKAELEKIHLQLIKAKSIDYYFKESYWSSWNGVNIEKTPEIQKLQENILQITEKVHNQKKRKQDYIVQDFFDENLEEELMWEDYFREKGYLHITFWKNNIQKGFENINFPKNITFEKLVIWQMGNYGSVRKILFEKIIH